MTHIMPVLVLLSVVGVGMTHIMPVLVLLSVVGVGMQQHMIRNLTLKT